MLIEGSKVKMNPLKAKKMKILIQKILVVKILVKILKGGKVLKKTMSRAIFIRKSIIK